MSLFLVRCLRGIRPPWSWQTRQIKRFSFVPSAAKLHCLSRQDPEALQIQTDSQLDIAVCQNLVPLVNIKIAGKWMFIPLKMVLTGFKTGQQPGH